MGGGCGVGLVALSHCGPRQALSPRCSVINEEGGLARFLRGKVMSDEGPGEGLQRPNYSIAATPPLLPRAQCNQGGGTLRQYPCPGPPL